MESGQLLLKEWQAQAVLDMAALFYADPENRAAFKAWKKRKSAGATAPVGGTEAKK